MLNIGFHVSIAGGISKSFNVADGLGISTFQIFTRNSRGWTIKPLDNDEISKFHQLREFYANQSKFQELVVHMPYLPNLSSSNEEIYNKSRNALLEEITRCDILGINYLVLHLGSHKGDGIASGIKQVVSHLENALNLNPTVSLLLENSSGTKNAVGGKFEEINNILEKISDHSKIGVCFDTCHAFASGYDLRSEADVEKTLESFDQAIGVKKIRVIHCNDSKGPLGSNKDRHEHIGRGYIGLLGFKALLVASLAKSTPIILETPVDEICDDAGNLKIIQELERGIIPNIVPKIVVKKERKT
jgi:deoxyribonuclease-4